MAFDVVTYALSKKYTDHSTSALSSGFRYKGSVEYLKDLPASGEVGDIYTVLYYGESGHDHCGFNYAWGQNAGGTYQWIETTQSKGDRGEKGETGDRGPAGQDGLTVAVKVNGTTHTHSGGVITIPNYPSKMSELTNDNNTVRSIIRHANFNPDGSLYSTDCTWADIQEAYSSSPEKEIIIFGRLTDPDTGTLYHPILRTVDAKENTVIQFGGTYAHRQAGIFYRLCLYIPQTGSPSSELIVVENGENRVSEWSIAPDDINYPSEKLVKDSLDLKADQANLTSEVQTRSNADSVLSDRISALEGRQQYVLIRCGIDKYIDPSTLVEQTRTYDWTDFDTDNEADINIKAFLKVKYSMETILQLQAVLVSVLHTVASEPEEDEFQYWANITNPDIGSYPQLQQTGQFLHNAKTKISQFTNDALGTIKGSTTDGQITANANGTGTVAGWTTLKNRVTTLENTMPTGATDTPIMDGAAVVGTSTKWAREDHVHPSDTSKQSVSYKVSSWSAVPNDNNYPSEKLVKDSFVDKITSQTVGGTKTFSNDIIINGTTTTHNINSTGTTVIQSVEGSETVPQLKLKAYDDTYNTGVSFNAVSTLNGPRLDLSGYIIDGQGHDDSVKPIIRNVGDPTQDYDVVNLKTLNSKLKIPTYYLVYLNDDWTVNSKAADLTYLNVKTHMDAQEEVYLKIYYGDGSKGGYFYAKATEHYFNDSVPAVKFSVLNGYSGAPRQQIYVLTGNNLSVNNYTTTTVLGATKSDYKILTEKAVYDNFVSRPEFKAYDTSLAHTASDDYVLTEKAVVDNFIKQPVLIYDKTSKLHVTGTIVGHDSNNGLTNCNQTQTVSTWNIMGMDLSAFKSIKVVTSRDESNTGSTFEFRIPLDYSLTVNNVFVAGASSPTFGDRNRLNCVIAAVDANKTSFCVCNTFSLYGTAATTISSLYVVRVYGCYD